MGAGPADSDFRNGVEMPVAKNAPLSPSIRYFRLSLTTLRLMSSYVSVLCRLFAAAYYAILRNRALIMNGFEAVADVISKGALYMPSKKPMPDLRVEAVKSAVSTESVPEKSVHCDVLYDPGPCSRKMDVIFIHGLKGSLERTWTQGMWELKGQNNRGILLRKSSSASTLKELETTEMHRHSSEINLASSYEEEECKKELDVISDSVQQATSEQEEGESKKKEEHKKKKEVSRCWPRDWLPQDCPGVRVIALNYTTDPYLWRPVWVNKHCRSNMTERAWEMMQHLYELGVGELPIVWVGHSKGGLFVKQMLVHACESYEPKWKRLNSETKGILFYSVPHRGSPLANLNLPLLRQSIELTEVQKDSAEVTALHKKFRDLLDSKQLTVEVRSFIETTLTLMSLVYVRIVSVESADAEIGELYGVPIDHRNICKPRSRNCFLYRELVSLIDSVTGKATS